MATQTNNGRAFEWAVGLRMVVNIQKPSYLTVVIASTLESTMQKAK